MDRSELQFVAVGGDRGVVVPRSLFKCRRREHQVDWQWSDLFLLLNAGHARRAGVFLDSNELVTNFFDQHALFCFDDLLEVKAFWLLALL